MCKIFFFRNIKKLFSVSAKSYFNFFIPTNEIYSWKFKGISEERFPNITTSDNTFAPTLIDTRQLPVVKFKINCLIRSKVSPFRK